MALRRGGENGSGVVRTFLAPLLALRSRVGNQKRLGNRVSCWRYPNTSTNIAATRITSSFAADSNTSGSPSRSAGETGEIAQREFLILVTDCSVYNPQLIPRVAVRVFADFIK